MLKLLKILIVVISITISMILNDTNIKTTTEIIECEKDSLKSKTIKYEKDIIKLVEKILNDNNNI